MSYISSLSLSNDPSPVQFVSTDCDWAVGSLVLGKQRFCARLLVVDDELTPRCHICCSYGAAHLDSELIQRQSYTTSQQLPTYTTSQLASAAGELMSLPVHLNL